MKKSKGRGKMLDVMGSQDVRIALSNRINELFPDATVYTEHLPSSPVFPNFHVLILQVNRRQASRMQVRGEWDRHNVFFTVKHRVFDGLDLPPANLLAALHNVGYLLVSGMRAIRLGNSRCRIHDSHYELEPEGGVGLMAVGFYANLDVLVKIPEAPRPLQNALEYKIISEGARTGLARNDEKPAFKATGGLNA